MLPRSVFQQAYASYWEAAIDNCPDSRSLWRRLSSLLQPASAPAGRHSASDFVKFFTDKVEGIRTKTVQAPAPIINCRSVPQFGRFEEVTSHEVTALLRAAPNKQCSADHAPTWLVKQMGDVLAPVITDMINKSFEDGCFPTSQKRPSFDLD